MSSQTNVLQSNEESKKISSITAVFIPVILTLLGVVFFLRMGYIVAVSSFFTTTIIITLSTCISLITALSISSIATNMKIGSGGLYFILARTFGIELSSAISLPLFLAQSLNIAFYIMGFTEALTTIFPFLSFKLVSLTTLFFLTILANISAKSVLKTQFFIFILVGLGLISFFLGKNIILENTQIENLKIPTLSFWVLFALFFPSVTGIESGLALSKDLKNPSKSLPKALLTGIFVAYLIYLFAAYFLKTHASQQALYTNPMVMKSLAYVPALIIIAICLSTLSGALSMLLTAPKMLQALAEDEAIPSILGKGFGKEKLPRLAIIIAFFIALFGLTIGGMNTLAPILTMFFLISYCMINIATALEAMIANPSWRPTFKTPWYLSFIGSVICIIVMLMINPGVTLISFVLILSLYFIMKSRHLSTKWEDFRHSILLFLARFAIYKLAKFKPSAKTWRPNLLVFVGDPLLRSHLINLTSALTHKKGFLTMTSIVDYASKPDYELLEEQKLSLFLEKAHVPAIVNTYRSESLLTGMVKMIEHFGIGAISPNTIALGATRKEGKYKTFAKVIKSAYKKKKNILIIKENSLNKVQKNPNKIIDVWWSGGLKNNPELMLALAYMLQSSVEWRGSTLKLKTAISHDSDRIISEEKLKELSTTARLDVKLEIVKHDLANNIFEDTIKKSSSSASLVFLGLRAPSVEETDEEYAEYYKTLLEKTKSYPTTIFVLCGEDLEFSKIFN